MKKILLGSLIVVVILGCSFHFSIVYLNYIRTLGIGFTPMISTLKSNDMQSIRRIDFMDKSR